MGGYCCTVFERIGPCKSRAGSIVTDSNYAMKQLMGNFDLFTGRLQMTFSCYRTNSFILDVVMFLRSVILLNTCLQ